MNVNFVNYSIQISSVAFVVLEPAFENSFKLTNSDEWYNRVSSQIVSDKLIRTSAEMRNTESTMNNQDQNAIIDVIDDIVRKYSIETVWEKVKKELEHRLKRLMDCETTR